MYSIEQEYQANYFAMCLLMPKKEFIKKIDEHTKDGIIDTKEVAKHFGVSVSLASLYGQELGIFKKDF